MSVATEAKNHGEYSTVQNEKEMKRYLPDWVIPG